MLVRGANHATSTMNPAQTVSKNVLGTELKPCSKQPLTGFFRDGCCNTSEEDHGVHTVCVEVTDEFLEFSKQKGNDLSTPRPEFDFAGLKEGNRWCMCAARWVEALAEGKAPRVVLESTHERTLDFASLAVLQQHAIPG